MEAYLKILNDKAELPDWNDTFIVLIPKVKNPRSVSDFRPISLYNVSYKIISKSIANRLKNVIGLVVSEAQSAFVPHRAITDNVIIGHKCLYTIKSCKSGLI